MQGGSSKGRDGDTRDVVDVLLQAALVTELFSLAREEEDNARGKQFLECPTSSEPSAGAESRHPTEMGRFVIDFSLVCRDIC
jgi:hypothetical protein